MTTYLMPIYDIISRYFCKILTQRDGIGTTEYGKSKVWFVFAYWIRTTLPSHNIYIAGLANIAMQYAKWTIDDFSVLTVLGRGAFAKVMQVRTNLNGKIYALKVIKKKPTVKRDQVPSLYRSTPSLHIVINVILDRLSTRRQSAE